MTVDAAELPSNANLVKFPSMCLVGPEPEYEAIAPSREIERLVVVVRGEATVECERV